MKVNKTLTALIASAGLGLSGHAFAAGTLSNSTITNTSTLDYTVAGVNQNDVTSQVDFKVDYKVDMAISATAATGNAAPGETISMTFALKNDGNLGNTTGTAAEAQAFAVSVDNNGATEHTPISVTFYSDVGLTTTIPNNKVTVLPDQTVTFYAKVELSKDASLSNGDNVEMIVSARALAPSDTDGTTFLNQDLAANKNLDDTSLNTSYVVFADSATGTDAAQNGIITDDFLRTMSTAEFTYPNDPSKAPKLDVAIINDIICDKDIDKDSTKDYSTGGADVGTCPTVITANKATYRPKAIPNSMAKFTYQAKNTGDVPGNDVSFSETLTSEYLANSLNTATLKVGPSGSLASRTLTPVTDEPDATNEYRIDGNKIEIFIGDVAKDEEIEITFTAIVE